MVFLNQYVIFLVEVLRDEGLVVDVILVIRIGLYVYDVLQIFICRMVIVSYNFNKYMYYLVQNGLLKEGILQDINFCSLVVVN